MLQTKILLLKSAPYIPHQSENKQVIKSEHQMWPVYRIIGLVRDYFKIYKNLCHVFLHTAYSNKHGPDTTV